MGKISQISYQITSKWNAGTSTTPKQISNTDDKYVFTLFTPKEM